MYSNIVLHKALLAFGTAFWLALAAHWFTLVTWQAVAIVGAGCVLGMMVIDYLPGPAELFCRRSELRVELQQRLVDLQPQLVEAKSELERYQNILRKTDLSTEMQTRYRVAYRVAHLSVINTESQIAQTIRDVERLQVKINRNYAELEQLSLVRARLQLAQQALRVARA